MTPNTDHNEEREKQPSSPSLSVSSKTSNKSRHTKREFRPVSEVTGTFRFVTCRAFVIGGFKHVTNDI